MDLSIWRMGLEFSSTCSSVPRRIVSMLSMPTTVAMSRSPMRFGFCAHSTVAALRHRKVRSLVADSIPLRILSAACPIQAAPEPLPLIYSRLIHRSRSTEVWIHARADLHPPLNPCDP